MKAYNAITDDNGVTWEMVYDEVWYYPEGVDPRAGEHLTRVENLRYRIKGDPDGEYHALPPWATVLPSAAISLCFFDEDERDGSLTLWQVSS